MQIKEPLLLLQDPQRDQRTTPQYSHRNQSAAKQCKPRARWLTAIGVVSLAAIITTTLLAQNTHSSQLLQTNPGLQSAAKLACPAPATAGNLRVDCGNVTTTAASCVASGCCWDVSAPGYASCYNVTVTLPSCPAVALSGPNRVTCGAAATNATGCTQSGCCWNKLAGSSSCYQVPTAANTCPTVQIAAVNRTDCGNAQTTPSSCTASGCCWNIPPQGQIGPACYNTSVTAVVPLSTCSAVPPIAPNRIDCGNITTTQATCLQKGCCWNVLAGAVACYNPPSKTCPLVPFVPAARKPCGTYLTSPQQCNEVLGCCWDVVLTFDTPSCYDPSVVAAGYGVPGSDHGLTIPATTSNPGTFAVIATSPISPLGVAQMPNSNDLILMERFITGNATSTHSYAFNTGTNAFRTLHLFTGNFPI